MDRCTTCDGAGQVERTERRLDGPRTYYDQCPRCEGRGTEPDEDYASCEAAQEERGYDQD